MYSVYITLIKNLKVSEFKCSVKLVRFLLEHLKRDIPRKGTEKTLANHCGNLLLMKNANCFLSTETEEQIQKDFFEIQG